MKHEYSSHVFSFFLKSFQQAKSAFFAEKIESNLLKVFEVNLREGIFI